MASIDTQHFTEALFTLLDEAFDNVHGYFLDRGDSLFETLAGITAAEASIPVGGKCATLAAQVKHVAFYLDVAGSNMRDPDTPAADWGEIWRTVSVVTPQEWETIINELRASYDRILRLIDEMPAWRDELEIGNAMAVVAHTAYHLGEIRQALCTIKP
jgi:hypothetical protein